MKTGDTHYERRKEQVKASMGKKKLKCSASHILALVKLNMQQAIEKRRAMKSNEQQMFTDLREYWEKREDMARKGVPMGALAKKNEQNGEDNEEL